MEDDPLLERKGTTKRKQIQRNGPASAETSVDEIDHIDVMATHKPKNDFTAHLALSIAACTLGSSFQYGYNTGVVNAPEKVLKEFYNTTYHNRHNEWLKCGDNPSNCTTLTILWAATVSIYCIGGMMGGVSAGYWANRFGRKRTLLLNNIIMVIALVVEISSKNLKSYEVLIIGRFIMGINAGINTGVAPMYLSEISPVSLRGLCGTFNQLCITFGVFISTVMGLDNVLGTDAHWQYALGFPAIMVVWQLCTLSFCPESPRFILIQRHSEEEAERALVWLRGTHDVSDEIEEMIAEREHMKHVKKFTVRDLFHTEELRTPLVICLAMHLSQQLAGINAVIYYSTSIFETAGLSLSASQYATLGTGAVNVSMTFVSALVMDKIGRRSLHLLGLGGMFVASYILTLGLIYDQYDSGHSWVGVVCVLAVVLYIIFFASGPGAIPWFFTAELFAQGPRPAAVSIGVLVNWSANFCVGLFYPFLQEAIKAYSFIPFVVFLAIFWVYTLFRVPETKGKTIEEITAQFQTSAQYSRIPLTEEDG